MDLDLERALQEELRTQAAGRPIAASSANTYAEKLRAWWRPYAEVHGMVADFTAPGARALTPAELVGLIGAAHTGQLRRLSREGASRDRCGQPLSASSLTTLLAALRDAHLTAGLHWHGSSKEVAEVLAGYRRTHGDTRRRAAAMSSSQATTLLARPSHDPADTLAAAARARAIGLALRVPLRDLAKVTKQAVRVDGREAVVALDDRVVVVPCLRALVDDVVVETACAHCALRDWARSEDLGPLLTGGDYPRMRRSLGTWIDHLPGAHFDGDLLTIRAGGPWTAIAVGLPHWSQAWLRARAVLLPGRVAGLGLEDMGRLGTRDVQISSNAVTFTVRGRGNRAMPPHTVTLEATGDAMCPVTAARSYENWVRAHGLPPDRPRWISGLRGKDPYRYPIEFAAADDGRALYQAIRLWLVANGPGLEPESGAGPAHLTPLSVRRGFATQARAEGLDEKVVQQALGHSRVSTTMRFVEAGSPGAAAHRLLDRISKGPDGFGD